MNGIYEKYNIKTKNTKQIFFVRRICSELREKKGKKRLKKKNFIFILLSILY